MWELDRQVEAQKKVNQQTKTRNAVLDAEVRDLKQGTDAVEERARSELGMIKPGEIFFQVVGEDNISGTAPVAAKNTAKK